MAASHDQAKAVDVEAEDKNEVEEIVFRDESARFNLPSRFYQETPRTHKVNLVFVNVTTSSGATQDSGKRRLVRSHVMQNVHEQKRQLQEQGGGQAQRLILPNPRPARDLGVIEALAQQGAAEPEFGAGYEELDWNPTTSHQSTNTRMALGAQGSFVSGASVTATDNATPIENMLSELGTSSFGNILPYESTYSQDGDAVGFLAEAEEPSSETLDSEALECQLISQSFKLNSLSRGRIDPFDTLPGLRNARTQALIYHYNQVLVRTMLSVAVDPDDKWLGYSVTDPALFHSTMLHSAAHNAMLAGNTDLADPVPLKWEAIRLVNGRLGDSVLSLSDVTIGAVVALVLYENQSANVEFSNVHMDGLSQMVRLRGGLQNLGLAGILRRKILWADLCNSMYNHSKPRFDNFLSPKSGSKEEDISLTSTSIRQSQTYSTQLVEIFASLKSLSMALSGPFSRTAVVVDDIYSLERRVVLLLAETHPTVYPGSNLPLDEQRSRLEHIRTTYRIALAAQIYIYLFLRDNLVRSPIFSVLVSRLSNSLYSSEGEPKPGDTWLQMDNDNNDENAKENEMLFWVLVIGALAANGREERKSFATRLRAIQNVLRVWTFMEFVEKLKKIAWIETRADDTLLELWSEVQGLEWRNLEPYVASYWGRF